MWFGSTGCALIEKGAGSRSECSRIAELSRTGEHKPAVDAAREMESSGMSCPPEVREAVSVSAGKLSKADSYVHKAVKRRKEGNLLSARANLERALTIYPKYYWVQTLIKNVDRSINAELDSLKHEASYFESRGDPQGALSRVQDAMKLSPGDKELSSEAARLKQLIMKGQDEQRAQTILDKARAHLDAGRYEEARQTLTSGSASERSGARGKDMLAEIDKRRQEHAGRRFNIAVEKEKAGDLSAAADHTLQVLVLSRPGDPSAGGIVNFARLLGMKFYSAGELSRARELWSSALEIDPGSEKLKGYLQEVDTRLDDLDRIKKGGE